MLDDDIIPESNRTRLNETTLNYALKAHEKGLHSSFDSDYHLCRSGQALNMLLFPKSSVDCPMCHACKINKSLPSPGGANKTKSSIQVDRNRIPLAPVLASPADDNMKNANDTKKVFDTKEIDKRKSLLSSRIKLRVPSVNTYVHQDLWFMPILCFIMWIASEGTGLF